MNSIGDRIKFLRNLLGFTGKDIEKISNGLIKQSSLSSIENGRVKTLSSKSAKNIVNFFNKQNVNFTIEWLTTGIGKLPNYTQIAGTPEKLTNVASRLRYIRKLANLSRADFENLSKNKLTKAMISLVENNANNLTYTNAKIIVNILKSKNIKCSLDWLLFGIGELPDFLSENDDNLFNPIKESEYFKSINPDSIVFSAKDSYLPPLIQLGDLIGALPHEFDQEPYLGVLILTSGKMDIKMIRSFSEDLLFLSALDSQISEKISKKEILESYKIVWIRKP